MNENRLCSFVFIIMGVVGFSETLVSLGEGKAFLSGKRLCENILSFGRMEKDTRGVCYLKRLAL